METSQLSWFIKCMYQRLSVRLSASVVVYMYMYILVEYIVTHMCMYSICFKSDCNSLIKVFRLLSGSEEKYLAPGLKLPVVIQYSPLDAGSHKGCLEVFMENTLVHTVPIIA